MLDAPKKDSMVGITIGFSIGLAVLHGFEGMIEYFENLANGDDDTGKVANYEILHTLPPGKNIPPHHISTVSQFVSSFS